MGKIFWNDKKVKIAKEILGKCTTLQEGLQKISREFQKSISEDSLRGVFRRFNEKTTPHDCLMKNRNTYSKQDFINQQRVNQILEIFSRHTSVSSAYAEIKRKLEISPSTVRNDLKRKFGRVANPQSFLKDQVSTTKDTQMESLAKYIKNANKKKRKVYFRDLCDEFDMAPSKMEALIEDARGFGYKINFQNDSLRLDLALPVQKIVTNVNVPTTEKQRIRLGVVSDTHFGSDGALIDELKHFVDLAYTKFKVRTFLHCGDILAGNRVYRGQEAEVNHWGCDSQVESAVKHLPKRKNLEWYGILGNHDVSFIKLAGIDVGEKLADKRKDFHYIGSLKEKIVVNGVEIELAHLKSSAHARSYSLEKHIYRTYSKSNQPQALFCGHKHTNGYFEVQRIHTFLVPCFEDPSLFLQYSDFMPSIGGIIVDFVLDEYANIIRVEPKFHLYHHKDEEVIQIQTNNIKDTKSNGKPKRKGKRK